jgi:hypothetical protein
MPARKFKTRYSWKEKYDHAYNCYCSLFNSALNYIAGQYGPKALDRYFKENMEKSTLGKSTFSGLKGRVDAETFLRAYVPHHLMIGGDLRVVKADEDEIIVDLITCGSKKMLVEKFGKGAEHYCRHCEVIPLWEQLGWESIVDKSKAKKAKGQNIGCRRIFRRRKK